VTETPEKPTAKAAPSQKAAAQSDEKIRPRAKPKRRPAAKKPTKNAAAKKPTVRAKKPAPPPEGANQLVIARTGEELRKATSAWREKGAKLALVPTMGALHEGHVALVEKAKSIADRVIVSVFVNPTQFAPHEDLDRYPRDEASDFKKLAQLGVDAVWAPTVDVMYPDGFTTQVTPGKAAAGLESDFRPHFFSGVATVVAKLFNQVRPDFAMFGEKDYQQLIVVKQLARDLDMGLEVVPVATVREEDGLALSSRNAYLSEADRGVAANLNLVLKEVAEAASHGASIAHLKAASKVRLLTLGFEKVDYIEVLDAETLRAFDSEAGRPGRVLGAAWLGRTRLIDNVPAG
jgi:pantoate--beta-alanine ligase